ncbi:MAG: signal recognition particle-docking protein FtsY [Candidatus Eutrophobiaceae bacterium]
MFTFKRKSKSSSEQANLQRGLNKTRTGLLARLFDSMKGRAALEPEALEKLEERLLLADVGLAVCGQVMDAVQRQKPKPQEHLAAVAEVLERILAPIEQPLQLPVDQGSLVVILMIGINGAGKTTTIGKLACQLKGQNLDVQLAAADTFRAAAVEQLQRWGERNEIPVTARLSGGDPAAVVYDALLSAQAARRDVLIVDTAGRLHTNANLMAELQKLVRVIGKLLPEDYLRKLLVLDAGIGRNTLTQLREFDAAIGIDGLVLTKLDGTAKGGAIFSIAHECPKPMHFLGVGEQIDDLLLFDAKSFVAALLGKGA